MPGLPRSIEQILEHQAMRWVPPEAPERVRSESRATLVTVSRQLGSGGGEIAHRLAQELGVDYYDREIIRRIAESAHLDDRVVSEQDEHDHQELTDWLAAFSGDSHMSASAYRQHLTRVVEAIGRRGGAVILGRAAHLILKPGEALRLLVVAPLEKRVLRVMARESLSRAEAERRVVGVDAERAAFLRKHFHCAADDPADFDVVVNTGTLEVEGAVAAVRALLPVRVPA
jgi:cytidylate kinase